MVFFLLLIYRLTDQTCLSHGPIIITSKTGNAVLLSEVDWRAIQEAMYHYTTESVNETETHPKLNLALVF
jgi:PHD/YefM family antitoxin component YafN of YafNO toxin-antitoxin module